MPKIPAATKKKKLDPGIVGTMTYKPTAAEIEIYKQSQQERDESSSDEGTQRGSSSHGPNYTDYINRRVTYKEMRNNEFQEIFIRAVHPMTSFADDDDEFAPAISVLGVFFDISVASSSVILPLINWSTVSRCKTPIVLWLFVSAGILLIKAIKSALFVWILKTRRRDLKLKFIFDVLSLLLITLFELVWLVYAHTFQFSAASFECKYQTQEAGVWHLVILIMSLSYLTLVHVILIVVRLSCALRKKKGKVS